MMSSRLLYCMVALSVLGSSHNLICGQNQENSSFVDKMKGYLTLGSCFGGMIVGAYAFNNLLIYPFLPITKYIFSNELSLVSDTVELDVQTIQQLKQKIYRDHSTGLLFGAQKHLPLVAYIERLDFYISVLDRIAFVCMPPLRSEARILSTKLKKVRVALREDQSFKDELNLFFSTL